MTNPQLCRTVAALADYAREKGLIQPDDHTWAVNRLLEALEEDSFSPPGPAFFRPPGGDPGRPYHPRRGKGSLRG